MRALSRTPARRRCRVVADSAMCRRTTSPVWAVSSRGCAEALPRVDQELGAHGWRGGHGEGDTDASAPLPHSRAGGAAAPLPGGPGGPAPPHRPPPPPALFPPRPLPPPL